MKARELARLVAVAHRRRDQPLLPLSVDLVVTDIRRIADVERRGLNSFQCRRAVVTKDHLRPVGEPSGANVGAEHESRERVDL